MKNPEKLQNCQNWGVGACTGQYGMCTTIVFGIKNYPSAIVSYYSDDLAMLLLCLDV